MMPGGVRRPSEGDLLAHTSAVRAERKAQAILRRQHAAREAIAKIIAAPRRES